MKKSQIFYEFFILGAVLFILLLLVSYKLISARISCYMDLEHNLKLSTIMSEAQCIPAPIVYKAQQPYEDKILVTSQYFNYYIPSNIMDLSKHKGRVQAQKELIAAILQIEKQLDIHGSRHNKKLYNNFFSSIKSYTECNDSRLSRFEKKLDTDFEGFKKDLLSSQNTISIEGAALIDKFVAQIKELSKLKE